VNILRLDYFFAILVSPKWHR